MARKKQSKQTYPKENEDNLRDTLQKLKSQVRNLTKQNKELRSKNSTLLEAWAKTEAFLAEVTDGVPLVEVMKHRTLPSKVVKKTDKIHPKKENIDAREQTREKFKKWRKENLE